MFSRENITLGVILICVIATVYLFKEMKDMKSALDKPPQIVRVPVPVQQRAKPVRKEVPVSEEEDEETDEE